MKITVLVENTSEYGLPAEHGLSLYIETGEKKILFDTGQAVLFADNAENLGINLADVDLAVISHGHYDHGGGLSRFLSENSKAPVYINRHAFEPHYNAEGKYIGLDISLKDSERLIYTNDTEEICNGITLYSCNNKTTDFKIDSSGLTMMQDGKILAEDFRHEQYLLVNECEKNVLISGCSHKGILNIVSWFRPDVLIGGFHFMNISPGEQLVSYAQTLDSCNTVYYTCHCTGTAQYNFMKQYMKNLHYISAGQIINI